ncbi:Ti-type conjugative transfer relaxase TraA [Brevundimonas sp.]|uniref:Ti-type conjugative transfer relaxase TraA n=1 Tax=Brevundimonas sp. TaxID=1871086 RepID=UPI002BA401EE|nr:Ti-type conjugative transfer relaxase TraA [Brevundimonas sp.]HWQ86895.1 Ti-type conjugative transfer relaxase TraA [Brevundimonas sp.]
MAIYHFSAKVISRANGSSAVAAAAYRSASRLHDERLDRSHDFSNKAGVIHSEILAPKQTPERWQDRTTLWNEVEAGEKRKDAQLAREVEFSIPREMSRKDGIELARSFVQKEFVDRGMVADLNVHWDTAKDGSPKPHAHVMLTMREARDRGFGAKVRDWNGVELLTHWREAWAEHANEHLARLDIDARIDHRSFVERGIELEPQDKIGPAGARREDRGEAAERAADHRGIARRNGELIAGNPHIALDAITHQQSTFTRHDLARFAHRHSDGKEQFDKVMSAISLSADLVALGKDGHGRDRFTSRDMLAVEQKLERSASRMSETFSHELSGQRVEQAIEQAKARGLNISGEQRDALESVTRGGDLALVVGYAGSGKSAMLGAAKQAWEAEGLHVRGAALSGIAAENLEGGSGINSRTLASLEHAWVQGREHLTSNDVLVIDEAGLVGSRQMQRIVSQAESAGAKVVMVGDPEQLQAIEAGSAFRALSARHGAVEITEVRRQHAEWQRQATRELATGRTEQAIDRYSAAGFVRDHATHADARVAVVSEWSRIRDRHPEASQIMLAYTRRDVAELNTLARESLRRAGALGKDRQIVTTRGVKQFATGDRIMFLRNDRSIGVKNGSLGEVEAAGPNSMTVRLDRGAKVSFDPKFYPDVDHGYAATIHKSQGVTVDSAHVLATSHMDRQAANVAMTRHRSGVFLHYGRDAFSTRALLTASLGRDGAKDVTLDYLTDFAERHGGVVDRSFDDRQGRFLSREPNGLSPKRSPKTGERARDLGDDGERSR